MRLRLTGALCICVMLTVCGTTLSPATQREVTSAAGPGMDGTDTALVQDGASGDNGELAGKPGLGADGNTLVTRAPGVGKAAPGSAGSTTAEAGRSSGSGVSGRQPEVASHGPAPVGILTVSGQSDEDLAAAGFSSLSTGDSEGNWRVLLDDVNARGGVAGRKVGARHVPLRDLVRVQAAAGLVVARDATTARDAD